MLLPRYQSLSILGFGKSVGTRQPIEAEIIVVRDFDELEQRSAEVCGCEKYVSRTDEAKLSFRFIVGFWENCRL